MNITLLQNAFRTKKGQSMVEMALVLPVLVLVITAIIDFGLLFNNYMVINNAAREGARNAAIGSTDAQISDIVTGVTGMLDQSQMAFTITPAENLREKGDEVNVTIVYHNMLLTPVISALLPNPLDITAQAIMRME